MTSAGDTPEHGIRLTSLVQSCGTSAARKSHVERGGEIGTVRGTMQEWPMRTMVGRVRWCHPCHLKG